MEIHLRTPWKAPFANIEEPTYPDSSCALWGESESGSVRRADSASTGAAILFGWRGASSAWGRGLVGASPGPEALLLLLGVGSLSPRLGVRNHVHKAGKAGAWLLPLTGP